ncbi:MAG: DUF2231 domain-containing protein [Terriglobales bacterium]
MPLSLAELASRQNRLDPLARELDKGLTAAHDRLGPRGDTIASWLHGDPLGHPLHVMLTDVPLGAWTTAAVFDRLAGKQARQPWAAAARGAIAVGIVGALGAAVAGLADWHRLGLAETRRIGLVHATGNVLGLAAFTVSFFRRRRAGAGRRSALVGYALAIASAQLGGSLVYEHGAGRRGRAAAEAHEPAA